MNADHMNTHRLSRILFAVAFAAMLFYLAIYARYAFALFRFPFDYDQGEGFELVDVMMFSRGEWPYRDIETYPFYSSNYPPFFHVILVPFAWLFGPAYWYGRLAGFLATLITAGALSLMVRRASGHRGIAILSGLAYLASNTIYHVGPLFRQHIMMVMFEALAVYVISRSSPPTPALPSAYKGKGGGRLKKIVLALVLLLFAGYTKQLAVFTVGAVFVFLFLRDALRAVAAGVIFAAVVGAIFLLIDAGTGGAWFTNTVAANANAFVAGQGIGLLRQWFGLHGALIIPAALYALYELYFERISAVSLWWAASLGLNLLAGKWGAGDSYFATSIAATCALSGIAFGRVLRNRLQPDENYLSHVLRAIFTTLRLSVARHPSPRVRGEGPGSGGNHPARTAILIIIPALYLLYAGAVFHMPTDGMFEPIADALGLAPNVGPNFYDGAGWTLGYATLGHTPTEADYAGGRRIVEIVSEEPERPTLSEEAGFNLIAGKDVVTNPTQLLNLYNAGLYDPANLIAMIEEQAFGVVVLRAQFYPPPVLDAIGQAYRPREDVFMNTFQYRILEPDPNWPERRALRDAVWALPEIWPEQTEYVVAADPYYARQLVESLFGTGWEMVEDESGAPTFSREGFAVRVTLEEIGEERTRVKLNAHE